MRCGSGRGLSAGSRWASQQFVRTFSSQPPLREGGGSDRPTKFAGTPLVGGHGSSGRVGAYASQRNTRIDKMKEVSPHLSARLEKMKEVPQVELDMDEANLREQLQRQATLAQTALGRKGVLDQTREKLQVMKQGGVKPSAFPELDVAQAEDAAKEAEKEAQGLSEAALARKGRQTPLMEELRRRLELGGPIPVNEYMNLCLAHPEHGYYMSRDVFGSQGDFVTAPEISPLFGELVGVWVVWMWERLGSPKEMQLVELGPGRGTMMSDVLRTMSRFGALVSGLSVEMVETSPALREIQRKKLSSKSEEGSTQVSHDGTGVTIRWRDELKDVPLDENIPSIVLAQEFLDCLPIRQFQFTELGWCERMIDLDKSPDSPHHLMFGLTKGPSLAASALLHREIIPKLPAKPEINQGIEASAEVFQVSQEIGRRVAMTGGAALFIDYGNDEPSADSIQAIKSHSKVHIFHKPGECDVTGHVDFSAVRKAALDGSTDNAAEAAAYSALIAAGSGKGGGDAERDRASPRKAALEAAMTAQKVKLHPLAGHGPTTQCDFLHLLGIRDRIQTLMHSATDEQAESLVKQYTRLCAPAEMGSLFKVLAITTADIPEGTCAGFPPVDTEEATSTNQGTKKGGSGENEGGEAGAVAPDTGAHKTA